MAIDTKLRGCDLARRQVVDVMASGQTQDRASVLQRKTQKPVRIWISEATRASVAKWMEDPLEGRIVAASPKQPFVQCAAFARPKRRCEDKTVF